MSKYPLSTILESNKLTGPNYSDWLRNLKIVLDADKRTYVLTQSPPDIIPDDMQEDEKKTAVKWQDDDLQARCLLLATMSPDMQRQHEHMRHASEIFFHLDQIYKENDRVTRYMVSKELFQSRMSEGTNVHEYGIKILGLIEKLAKMNIVMENDIYIDLILKSLPPSF